MENGGFLSRPQCVNTLNSLLLTLIQFGDWWKKTEQFVVVQENILFTTILPQLNEHVENDV